VDDLATPWDEVQEAQNRVVSGALDVAGSYADAAVAAAEAGGKIVTDLDEARVRGEATIKGLYGALQQKGITDEARAQIRGMIEDLETAQESGDVEAILRLTGADKTTGQIDEATKDRDTTVRVESRNGPAVDRYLDGLADQRLALIRTESRNGPAVAAYLDSLTTTRLALIRVETRNGPAVDTYLDSLASQPRTAWIDVRERGAGATGGSGSTGAVSMLRGAPSAGGAGMYGTGSLNVQQLIVQLTADATGRVSQQSLAEAGRQAVQSIAAYERRNGTGWRQGGRR
jgi:hypothetical protein